MKHYPLVTHIFKQNASIESHNLKKMVREISTTTGGKKTNKKHKKTNKHHKKTNKNK